MARSALKLVHSPRAVPRVARGKLLARPLGAVAIRLPERMPSHLQLVVPATSPRLFVHEGARQALERKLTAAYPGPVNLSITDNRHAIISLSTEGGVLRARIHHMFLEAPPRIQEALIRYATKGDRDSSNVVGLFIEANSNLLAKRSRSIPLVTKGKHHDVLAIFQEVNERYFGGSVNALVTWSPPRKAPEGRARKTISLGSYASNDRLIRINPVLDRSWVPRYFVAFVVYHEMLHHVMPSSRGTGRRNLHPPEFLERERGFRFYERAMAWERRHLSRLLRS
jgi:hypothetical protein